VRDASKATKDFAEQFDREQLEGMAESLRGLNKTLEEMNQSFNKASRGVERVSRRFSNATEQMTSRGRLLVETLKAGAKVMMIWSGITIGHQLEHLGELFEALGERALASAERQMMVYVHFERLLYDLQRAQRRYAESVRGTSQEVTDWTKQVIKLSVQMGQHPEMVARTVVTLLDLAAAFKLNDAETRRFIRLMFDVSTFLDENVFQSLRHVRGAMMGLSYSAILLGINVEELRRLTEHYAKTLMKEEGLTYAEAKAKARLLAVMEQLNYIEGLNLRLRERAYGALKRLETAHVVLAQRIGEQTAQILTPYYRMLAKIYEW